uniref:MINDY deubiquitinase domain-containing protein n=1 Tax=Noctiluca scintillans TaxID=2966 RepID=A0A7S0ZRS7_NOCSC
MDDSTNSYRIKDINLFGSPRRILLQSANGPCPLLAICNTLLLRNQLKIPQDYRYVDFTELVQLVSNILFDANEEASKGDKSARHADVRENLASCLETLPKLNVGLDVNTKFGGPQDFEYTQELAVFDLLDVSLFHGWVVPRQDERAHKLFGHLSYNQVVERLIGLQDAQEQLDRGDANEDGALSKVVEDGLVIKDFMERTATQLSYEGLLELHSAVRERELAVFFRNSHFSTILRYDGSLFLLCTDISFAASHLVWERLDEVDGDTSYFDAGFVENAADSDTAAALAAALASQATEYANPSVDEQSSLDAMLAWQMQEAEQARVRVAPRAQRSEAEPQHIGEEPSRLPVGTPAQPGGLSTGGALASQVAPEPTQSPVPAPASTASGNKSKRKKLVKSCVVQ